MFRTDSGKKTIAHESIENLRELKNCINFSGLFNTTV